MEADKELRNRIAKGFSGRSRKPVDKPAKPVDKPAKPAKPAKPVDKPAKPVAKPVDKPKVIKKAIVIKPDPAAKTPKRPRTATSTRQENAVVYYMCVKCDKRYKTRLGLVNHSKKC
jgi:hypothetical protein